MDRRPRRSPTPAAVLTLTALAVLVLTYWSISWGDALDQDPEYPWPLDPATVARTSVEWTLAVILVCAVVWVAYARQVRLGRPWQVPVAVVSGVAVWCAAGWRAVAGSATAEGWWVPWPGPVPVATFVGPPDLYAPATLAVRPGALTPLVLLAACAAACWSARRHARAQPALPARPPHRRARAVALAVLTPPVLAAVVAASMLQLDEDDYLTATQRLVAVVVTPGAGLAAAVLAALALGGTGRAGRVLLGLVALVVLGPHVLRWWGGGADDLLATAALGLLAVAVAAAVHPVTAALARLDEPIARPVAGSVPEGADADDRARA